MCIACILRNEMEESKEQLDQPPPTNVTVCGDVDVDYTWLEQHAAAALGYLQKGMAEVSVRVVNDAEMSELHIKHSGVEGTTDVLTFDHGSDAQAVRADIAICVDFAEREANKRNHETKNELLLYIVHGILHCCGFDDHDESAHALMHAEEDRVLSAIGIGKVWSNRS
ncbi:MAG: rRNA maturation RNase YbeY [Phycisphaerae bacterium]|jgi:probable rRNA maturation factor|nr:rRNA maturation RNase YbeY [Phycisphaerae bacterium]